MFQNNRIQESAFGAAVKGAHLAMKSTGGKLLVFQTGSTISSYAFVTA
jgi:protein transport protein SEC24